MMHMGWKRPGWSKGSSRSPHLLAVGAVTLLLALALAGCDLGGKSTTSGSKNLSLSQLAWCDQPAINFQDDATTAQTQITDWNQVRDQLGLTTYLPATFPKGTCLVVAGGSIHDPLYGGHFDITYELPTVGPISFSEAPKRSELGAQVQCVSSPQDKKTTICLGVINNTSITIASRQSQSAVEALFKSLQANVNWEPSNTNKLLATPSPTGSA